MCHGRSVPVRTVPRRCRILRFRLPAGVDDLEMSPAEHARLSAFDEVGRLSPGNAKHFGDRDVGIVCRLSASGAGVQERLMLLRPSSVAFASSQRLAVGLVKVFWLNGSFRGTEFTAATPALKPGDRCPPRCRGTIRISNQKKRTQYATQSAIASREIQPCRLPEPMPSEAPGLRTIVNESRPGNHAYGTAIGQCVTKPTSW